MLTLFSIPKPSTGHIDVIQRNAIQSWLQFLPADDIVLCGDENGTAELAAEFRVRHLGGVERNEFGTPLVNSMFEKVQADSRQPILVYVNCDIILFADFQESIRSIPRDQPFLMIGQRWDLDVTESMTFQDPDWRQHLENRVAREADLHSPWGIDYFVFSRDLWPTIPPFAVGRMVYDNWFVYRARAQGARVVDATRRVTCVHQNHQRTYESVGLQGPPGESGLRDGVEARRNLELAGGLRHRFSIDEADWVLNGSGIVRRPWRLRGLKQRIESLGVLHPWLLPLVWGTRLAYVPRQLLRIACRSAGS